MPSGEFRRSLSFDCGWLPVGCSNIKAGRWIEVPAALCWALPYWVTAWHMLRAPDQYLRYREVSHTWAHLWPMHLELTLPSSQAG
jgi:hypothetical protein